MIRRSRLYGFVSSRGGSTVFLWNSAIARRILRYVFIIIFSTFITTSTLLFYCWACRLPKPSQKGDVNFYANPSWQILWRLVMRHLSSVLYKRYWCFHGPLLSLCWLTSRHGYAWVISWRTVRYFRCLHWHVYCCCCHWKLFFGIGLYKGGWKYSWFKL